MPGSPCPPMLAHVSMPATAAAAAAPQPKHRSPPLPLSLDALTCRPLMPIPGAAHLVSRHPRCLCHQAPVGDPLPPQGDEPRGWVGGWVGWQAWLRAGGVGALAGWPAAPPCALLLAPACPRGCPSPRAAAPAGDYPLHPDPEQNQGIGQWTRANRNLDGADCVLWVQPGHHARRAPGGARTAQPPRPPAAGARLRPVQQRSTASAARGAHPAVRRHARLRGRLQALTLLPAPLLPLPRRTGP